MAIDNCLPRRHNKHLVIFFSPLENLKAASRLAKSVLSAKCLVAQLCPTLRNPMDCSPLVSSVHGDSPGKNIGVGCHALLQGIFPTQGLNPGLLHCRRILYHQSHQEALAKSEGLIIPKNYHVVIITEWLKCIECLVSQSCPTLCDPTDCGPPGSSVHGDSPGKNIGVCCHAFLQGVFPTQGSNPRLLHCRWILYV